MLFRHGKVRDWLARYPPNPTDGRRLPTRDRRVGGEGVVGQGGPDRRSARSTTARAPWWRRGRGRRSRGRWRAAAPARSAGKTINNPWVWLTFCALFLLGLADLRRVLSLRNLDLLALLSFTVSLRFFNEGEIFSSVPLAYPPLALSARPLRVDRPARPCAALVPRRLAGVAAGGRGRLSRRLPHRAQRRGAAQRDRRRLRGRDRRPADRERADALRAHARCRAT